MVASPPRPAAVAQPEPAPPSRPSPNRAVGPRGSLPGSRALVGGLLVTLAAVGVVVAYRHATSSSPVRYLVAARDLQPGEPISTDDLATTEVDLPSSLRARAYTNPSSLRHGVVVAPISRGELIQSGQVADASRQPGDNLASFSVDLDRAAGGDITSGDRIALLVEGDDGQPAVVASGLRVIRVDHAGGDLGAAARLVVTVSVGPRQALGVAQAANPDKVTVIRTTGVAAGEQPRVGSRPDVGSRQSTTDGGS